jgi:hypothetical protein
MLEDFRSFEIFQVQPRDIKKEYGYYQLRIPTRKKPATAREKLATPTLCLLVSVIFGNSRTAHQ